MISVELVDEINEDLIRDILEIYKTYYISPTREFDFAYFHNYYEKVLSDDKSTLLVLKNSENILGYIYGIPQNKIYDELVPCNIYSFG